MTGRVFTKLLLSFLLVLSIGTAVLDFSVRRIVEHSLRREAAQTYAERARQMSAQLAATPPERLAGVVEAQAVAAHADIALTAVDGTPGPAVHGAGAAGDTPLTVLQGRAGPWRVRYTFAPTGYFATRSLLQRDLLLASLLALGLASLFAALVAWRVTRRLSRIVRFAHRIAAGELSARVEEGRLDEISEVAYALDTTAARLEASFRALDGSRRELSVLLDSMQEAVLGVSARSQITWSNTKMKALLPSVLREGRPLVECIRDPEVLRCVEVAMRPREAEQDEPGHDQLGQGRASSIVPGRAFAVSAAPMPSGGAVVVLHDITEVEQSERMRRDFVANVSHELRTPLTSITGYVETVLDGPEPLSPQSREFLQIVLRNAERMTRLTADLLALATIESNTFRLRTLPLRAGQVLEDALDSLAGMARDQGVRLELRRAPETLVLADPDTLSQVFGNLVENAMKYGRPGGRVVVGARDVEEGVEFSVQDFGTGIPSEHMERIFERFYRVDRARSRDSGGTGLGLAIVKHIVLAHGGRVWAVSELGSGSTFLFTLPRAPVGPRGVAPPG